MGGVSAALPFFTNDFVCAPVGAKLVSEGGRGSDALEGLPLMRVSFRMRCLPFRRKPASWCVFSVSCVKKGSDSCYLLVLYPPSRSPGASFLLKGEQKNKIETKTPPCPASQTVTVPRGVHTDICTFLAHPRGWPSGEASPRRAATHVLREKNQTQQETRAWDERSRPYHDWVRLLKRCHGRLSSAVSQNKNVYIPVLG